MQRKYFSIVFEIHDDKKFNVLLNELLGTMDEGADYRGTHIIACGRGDYVRKAEAYGYELGYRGVSHEQTLREYLESELIETEGESNTDKLEALTKAVMGL